jgi:hypothetical protein
MFRSLGLNTNAGGLEFSMMFLTYGLNIIEGAYGIWIFGLTRIDGTYGFWIIFLINTEGASGILHFTIIGITLRFFFIRLFIFSKFISVWEYAYLLLWDAWQYPSFFWLSISVWIVAMLYLILGVTCRWYIFEFILIKLLSLLCF